MSSFTRLSFFLSFGFLLRVHDCCPPAYTHCTTENNTCSLSDLHVIAYGADGFRWTYKQMSGAFTCHSVNFGDSVIGIAKECCYQSPTITTQSWGWVAGYTACNARIYSYVPSTSATHIWTFSTYYTYNATFSNCGSSIADTRLYLFDSSGTDITSGSCTGCQGKCGGATCATCYGNNCASDCDKDSALQEEFTYPSLPPGVYYIKFTTLNGPGNYHFSIACPGAINHYYSSHILSCSDNTITGTTTQANTVQYFQVNMDAVEDITFETCGSNYDTTLYIYSDSLYENQLIGGDNNACAEQESYQLTGLERGRYYVKIAPANTACNNPNRACFGQYTLTITCTGPTISPTPKPTIAPNEAVTTSPTGAPSPSPTGSPTVRPTRSPIASPTNPTNPSLDPTPPTATPSAPTFQDIPSSIATSKPTVAPTKSPTAFDDINQPPPPKLRPTMSPQYKLFLPTVAPKSGGGGIEMKANSIIIVAVVLGLLICCGFCVISFLKNGMITKQIQKNRRQRRKKKQVIPEWAMEGKEEENDQQVLVRGRTYDRMKSKSREKTIAQEQQRIAVELIKPQIVPINDKGVKRQIKTREIRGAQRAQNQPPKTYQDKRQIVAPQYAQYPLKGQMSSSLPSTQKQAHKKQMMRPQKQRVTQMAPPQQHLRREKMPPRKDLPRKPPKSRKPQKKKMIIKVEEYNPVEHDAISEINDSQLNLD